MRKAIAATTLVVALIAVPAVRVTAYEGTASRIKQQLIEAVTRYLTWVQVTQFIEGVQLQVFLLGVEEETAQAAAWAAAQPSVAYAAPRGGGTITQDQFAALNECEASGENGWRTGRYGLETGTGDVGQWSLEQQQARAQQIYDDVGAGAWGVSCRGILGG